MICVCVCICQIVNTEMIWLCHGLPIRSAVHVRAPTFLRNFC